VFARVPTLRDTHPQLDAKAQLLARAASGVSFRNIIGEDEGVYRAVLTSSAGDERGAATAFPRAGPRHVLFFEPSQVVAGIVTCGGLCPGLNSVVRDVVKTCLDVYGVRRVLGFHGGYGGIYGKPPSELTLESTRGIQNLGGTVLSSARGGFDADKILGALEQLGVNQLYVVGGDGTMRGCAALSAAVVKRQIPLSVVGIPKTIDNDVDIIDVSFGFDTAVEESLRAVRAACVEAASSVNGVSVVQVMGRHAGFIATQATLASGQVDLCLVPELPLIIDGSIMDVLDHVVRVVRRRGHAVIVVGEGAGEDVLGQSTEVDAGGNRKCVPVGPLIKDQMAARLTAAGLGSQVRFIDPSYMVRSVPANGRDSVLCLLLSEAAVHAAMAGFTAVCVGMVNARTALLPVDLVVATSPRTVNALGRTVERVISQTNQPYDYAAVEARAAKRPLVPTTDHCPPE